MRDQIVVAEETRISHKFGEYKIQLVKPAAAKVSLITHSQLPSKTAYLVTRAYKGIYREDITLEDRQEYPMTQAFIDIQNTKLQTPLEMLHTLWLLQDVTRAFTHQLVRYRVGTSFVQESMRFFGMKGVFKVLVTHAAADADIWTEVPDGNHVIYPPNLEQYMGAIIASIGTYVELLERGVPSEDARGVLPTNILTNIYFDCSFRTLQGIFPQRLCCQAQQGEWQPILLEMRKIIANEMGAGLEALLRAPYELGKDCGYRASFDRPCIWQKGTENGKSE